MRSPYLLVIFAVLSTTNTWGQHLSAQDSGIIQSARSRYYSLVAKGFQSASCAVNFDFSTIPLPHSQETEGIRRRLEATRFTVKIQDRVQPAVQYTLPTGTSEQDRQEITPSANLLQSLITGLFGTWTPLGLQGPIPPFDSEIESVAKSANGYQLMLRVPGGPVRVEMGKNYLVTEIVSMAGKVDEHPVYVPSADGLLFTGITSTTHIDPNGPLRVSYEIRNTLVDGLWLPTHVHLRVNSTIDMRFALTGCSVDKARVIQLRP